MHDRRVAQKRARAAFHRSEAERLDAEADAAEAARAAGVSQWGSELPPLFLLMVLKHLSCPGMWPRVFGAIRATCSTWSGIFDAWCPFTLQPRCWTAAMEGKMGWFPSVTWVSLLGCEEVADISSNLVELRSLPSLHTLTLPASCAERAADAEAVYGLTTLTELNFYKLREHDVDDELVGEAGEWVLDLSRLTTLTTLELDSTVTDKQVQAASNLSGLTELNLRSSPKVTTEGLRAIKTLTSLSTLHLRFYNDVATEGLRAVSSITSLTLLYLWDCENVTEEGLRALSSLTALDTLYLNDCENVSDAGMQALGTALPKLTIHEQ